MPVLANVSLKKFNFAQEMIEFKPINTVACSTEILEQSPKIFDSIGVLATRIVDLVSNNSLAIFSDYCSCVGAMGWFKLCARHFGGYTKKPSIRILEPGFMNP